MKKKSLISSAVLGIFVSINAFSQGPYAPAAGQPGSTAIHTDSSIIKSWAKGIELYRGWVKISDTTVYYNGSNKASFGYPSLALGKAQENSFHVVSLGDGGIATLTFDRPIKNGPGPDFAVFENGFSDTFLELAFVEVSSDGERFVRFPAVSLTQTTTQVGGFGNLDPTNIHNLAGKYRQGYGTPFDLNDIIDSSNIDLNNIRFVRIIDVVGSIDSTYATYDSQGHKINDPWPTPYHTCGFDLDAIGIINAADSFSIAYFDELPLAPDSYWNGSDGSGGFSINEAFFTNDYDPTYGSWSGFAYSNMRDDSTAGYTNQFSAITRGGMNATDTGGTNYAIGFVPLDWMGGTYKPIPIKVTFSDSLEHALSGFYVTNSTYAYLSMKNGDSFAKKFGGASGNDPDYFKLLIFGKRMDNTYTDTVEFYLADYRFADNTKDYIVDNWRWVDLQSLGAVKELFFTLESSDVGAYGMNTPAYFCIDNFTYLPHTVQTNLLQLLNPISDVVVEKNSPPVQIDISNVFYANDTTGIILSVVYNSNSNLVNAEINHFTLNLSFAHEQTGQATIAIQAQLGTQAVTDTFLVTVNEITTIQSNHESMNNVYPNPFNSQLTIECNPGNSITIFNIFGEKIMEQKINDNIVQLSTEKFNRGYYIVKISGTNGVQSIKVLKQ
ncbi:MAG: DUF4465 domain-containing protein [Bacteroidales bacterium]